MTATAQPHRSAAGTIAWVASQAGVVLPVRVCAWDGSEAGPPAAPTVVLRSPLALRRILWRPGELGLARAYVSGDLDVEGDLTEGLRRARRALPANGPRWGPARWAGTASLAVIAASRLGALGAPPAPPACELRHSGRPHSRTRARAVVAGHYDLPVSFFRLILDPSMAYSCGYTRHPNYFGDACMWWGIFLISYGSPVQLLTLVSPLLMTFILTRGTGQRMTERRMSGSRGGYADYIARTSGFIPLPPRRPRRPRSAP